MKMDLDQILDHPPGSVWRWFARRDGVIRGGFCETPYGLERIRLNHLDWNLYIGLNPTKEGQHLKVSDRDITHIQFILIDIDPVAESSQPLKAAKEAIDLGSTILNARLDPHLVDSGRGVQLWLQYERTPMGSDAERAEWQHRIHHFLYRLASEFGLRRGCRVDTSCSDLSRLARFPGSINIKTGRPSRFLHSGTPTAFSFEAPLRMFDTTKALRMGNNGLPSTCSIFEGLTNRARIFLTEGVSEPGRHSAAYAAAASLRDLGISKDVAKRLVQHGGNLCAPALGFSESSRCVDSAYNRPQ